MPIKADLMQLFDMATELESKYIGILVRNAHAPEDEVIINPIKNFDYKREYYQQTYDDALFHKATTDIQIVNFAYGDSFSEIENILVK